MAADERRLEREARDNCLGQIGSTDGVNVARVEVSWYYADGLEEAGHYIVRARGDEYGAETLYDIFDAAVTVAMSARQERLGFEGWQIDDTYAV